MEDNKSCIYITYDNKLKKYLDSIGIKNILYGLNPKSHNLFWVYERSKKLNCELDNYYK